MDRDGSDPDLAADRHGPDPGLAVGAEGAKGAEGVINERYRVLERLGAGGQGTVYRVADGYQAGRIKVLKAPAAQASDQELQRLQWEFLRLARLDHGRLLRVFDLELAEQGGGVLEPGQVFFTAEHAAGAHPAELMQRCGRRQRVELLWRILTDVASALDHIHGRGLVHGDVKPENLLCTAEGDVKLIDLGLSTVIGALASDEVAGTLDHLAPEALAGSPDPRSDLYALGSTLFTLATGRSPRVPDTQASGIEARLQAIVEQDPAPLGELCDWLPAGLGELVDPLLRRDPDRRPRSARLLLEQVARKRRTVSLALAEPADGLPLLATGVVGRTELVQGVVEVLGARLRRDTEASGPPAVVVLRGEPGVGRATAAAEALRALQLVAARGKGAPFAHAQGTSLSQAAGTVLGRGVPEPADDASLVRLVSALESLVARRPVVLFVEEGEADAAALRRLFALTRRDPQLALGRLGMIVRAEAETDLGAAGQALDRTVEPLSGEALSELVSRALGEAPPQALVDRIAEASQGVPALVKELLAAAWERAGDRRRVAEVDPGTVSSDGLLARARKRLNRLPEAQRRLARGIALAGDPLPLEWAADLAGPEPLPAVEALEALEGLRQAGLVVLSEGKVRLIHGSLGHALREDPGAEADDEDVDENDSERAELHRRLAQRYALVAEQGQEEGREEAQVKRVRHLAAAPPAPELPALALEVAGRAGERGEWRRAAELLQLGYEALPTAERDELGLALAEARVRAGEYAQGLRALEGIEAGGKDQGQDAALALRVATLRGLALQRQGRLDEARQVLQKALEALETQPAWPAQRTGQAPDALDHHGDPVAGAAVEARALLGRVLLAQGGIGEARALCATALEPKAPAGRAGLPLLEVGGLAALYAGELDEAAACFAAAVERARAAEKKRVSSGTEGEARDRPEGQGREHGDGDARPWAPASGAADRLPRALACEGMACQARGDLAGAAERYQEAYQLAEQRGDVHGAAHYGANLGAVLREQGRLAEALAPSVTAVRRMVQLGHTAELPVAVYNLGNLLLTLGDLAGTVQELRLLQAESTRTDTPLAHGYLHLLAAELSVRIRREGRRAPRGLSGELRRPASALAREAEQWFARAGAPREAVYAAVTLVEALVAEGKATRAAEAVPALQRRAAALDDPLAPHTLCLARARIRLAGGALPELGEELRRSRDYLLEAQRPDLAWRAAVLCAAQAQQAEDPERLGRHITKALELALAQRERLPESYRDAWDRDPDAVRLARLERSVAPAARGTDSQRLGAGRSEAGRAGIGRTGIGRAGAAEPETAVLRRLLEINKRLNTEHRLPILLELVLDAVLELIDAERGFILLQGEGDALEVRVARNMDRRNLGAGERSLSRSIAEDAAARGEPVMTVDAAMDERFSDAVSVHGLRLRSVLAVPLRVKGRVVGTVYVDNRLRRGAFQQADLALVQDFAQQAAIAIDNARLHEELVVKRRRIEELNRELASKVERQEAEIADMRTELKESQAALRVRYDYSNIVGESPGMLELFRLLDRITDVELPVVIHGESGTGKELVARAIHHNGPRSERPFVSENCGALPETLLESILFGHVKGAFTGADRDRKGLFEVAHGGTLFLDEVGEMSPAMQTKLLRVLQDGEVRRVGGDRVVQVDVRIIAASNQKLDQLVDRGSFRQDLYYRLNVLSVELPPLRERPEDLPLLVEHFIQKYSADRPRRLSRGALDRLLAHPWPGNVRELENEIQRVLALGGDLIGEADLSGAIRGGEDPPLRADDLDVRRHVELLERDLLRRALERTEGNQTRAAKLLGLSRYGLLKKLRRYDMLPSTGSE